jgi:ferredoxin-thioredoxin reductase catalytic subunit
MMASWMGCAVRPCRLSDDNAGEQETEVCTLLYAPQDANPKYLLFHPLNRIFEHIHETLNIDKKNN